MGSTHLGSGHGAAEAAATILRTTPAIRARARQLLERARRGESRWFTVEDAHAETAAKETEHALHGRHPPLHSFWRLVEAGGLNRRAQLDALMGAAPVQVKSHALVDFTTLGVLLGDMPAGRWRYTEAASGGTLEGPEGLAVATFHAFAGGLFSSDARRPLQADTVGLRSLVTEHLAAAFQVTQANPLPGIADAAIRLRRLGEIMAEQPEVFGESARPGGLLDELISPLGPATPHTADVAAHDVLSQILMSFSALWADGNSIGTIPLGDCWRHEAVRGEGASDGWMPLHAQAQWLAGSLLEPLEWCGVKVREPELLTPLADGANGGLVLDSGWLALRDAGAAQQRWKRGDEIVVEWRALTVAMLDELGNTLRDKLRLEASHDALARIQGGTSAAGRAFAARLRDGRPPLTVAGEAL